MVTQSFEVEADNEYVIRGNSAVMRCEIPSYVADFVQVDGWQDSDGKTWKSGEEIEGFLGKLSKVARFVCMEIDGLNPHAYNLSLVLTIYYLYDPCCSHRIRFNFI